jgi:hypothetical protein
MGVSVALFSGTHGRGLGSCVKPEKKTKGQACLLHGHIMSSRHYCNTKMPHTFLCNPLRTVRHHCTLTQALTSSGERLTPTYTGLHQYCAFRLYSNTQDIHAL